jgi:hypothetical protein
MPFIKRSLTRAEDAVYLGRAEQLRASGVDIEIPEERRADACALDIVVARPPASLVCDLPQWRGLLRRPGTIASIAIGADSAGLPDHHALG